MSRCDDLVALAYSVGLQGQQERDLAARNGDRVLAAKILREGRLELLDDGPRRQPRRQKNLADSLEFDFRDIRIAKGQKGRFHALSSRR